jgi:glycosyltransferase involved in cell wall biosynthesis
LVLFPRTDLQAQLRELTGTDVGDGPPRHTVVPEGIDLARVERAAATIREAGHMPAVVSDLQGAISALPVDRHGLPLIVSVGRLHEAKGMARLVEAFAADPDLRRRANLVIVGGDLDDPTPEERAEIDRIEAVFVPHPEMADGLVMLGHRPHDDVLRVLAAAEGGLGPDVGSGGAYACASRKEEFGLAIVEALATGLPVVAPRAGGPSSYVEDGVAGRLVDTLDEPALAAAIHDALDLAGRPGRAEQARSLVAERFSIRAMADALIPVYAAALRIAASPATAPVSA